MIKSICFVLLMCSSIFALDYNVSESGGTTQVNESTATLDSLAITVPEQPTSNIVLYFLSDSSQVKVLPNSMLFSPASWASKNVNIYSRNDIYKEGEHSATLSIISVDMGTGKINVVPKYVKINILDNDAKGNIILPYDQYTLRMFGNKVFVVGWKPYERESLFVKKTKNVEDKVFFEFKVSLFETLSQATLEMYSRVLDENLPGVDSLGVVFFNPSESRTDNFTNGGPVDGIIIPQSSDAPYDISKCTGYTKWSVDVTSAVKHAKDSGWKNIGFSINSVNGSRRYDLCPFDTGTNWSCNFAPKIVVVP